MSLISSDKFIRGATSDRSFCSVYTITEVNTNDRYSMDSLAHLLDEANQSAKRLLTANLIRGYLKLPVEHSNVSVLLKYVARVTSVKVLLLDIIQQVKALDGLGYVDVPIDDKYNDNASGSAAQISRNHHVESVVGPDVNNKKTVGLLYCHKACQLSDHCHSWSFCRANSASWCKLAQLELTKPVLESLTQSKTRDGSIQGFLIQYPPDDGLVDDQHHNNIYYLEKDKQCSLHSKDYFQLYQQHPTIPIELEPNQLKQFAFVSLDECARLCFRHELPSYAVAGQTLEPVCVRFDYCPVISLCHFEGLSEGGPDGAFYSQGVSGHGNGAGDALQLFKSQDLEQQFNYNQQCHRYERNYFQYFTMQQFQRLTITDLENGRDIYLLELEIKLENLDLNQCVRHCVLADERCLAFDYCRASIRPPHTTCVILTIRSPNIITNAFINKHPEQLSELEKKYYMSKQEQHEQQRQETLRYKIAFRDQVLCDHYDLLDTYANIKLTLARDKYLADSAIMQQDKDISAQLSPVEDTNDGSMPDADTMIDDDVAKTRSVGGISSGVSFVIGLMMGIVLYLVGPGLVQRCQDWRQERAARATRSTQSLRFSVLNLAQNEQLPQSD